jgi:hypothetical protein
MAAVWGHRRARRTSAGLSPADVAEACIGSGVSRAIWDVTLGRGCNAAASLASRSSSRRSGVHSCAIGRAAIVVGLSFADVMARHPCEAEPLRACQSPAPVQGQVSPTGALWPRGYALACRTGQFRSCCNNAKGSFR